MRGYKGIRYTNGILRAKVSFEKTGEIFEVGVPKQKVIIDEEMGFSENGYSFCGNIEEVLAWENFCIPLKNRKPDSDIRLFLIDTLDSKVIGDSSHYKAEQIVLLREITHNEIVQYFTERPNLKTIIKKELWEIFCNDNIEEYKLIINADEINKTLVKNCFRLGQPNLCEQEPQNYSLVRCDECRGKMLLGNTFYDLTDYYYLHARRKIYDGMLLEEIEEYKKLNGCVGEQNSLKLLNEWLKNNK